MQSSDLFQEIGQILPTGELPQVLAALRQEKLVWQSLERPEFLRLAVETLGNQISNWNPGRLALLALGDPRTVESLRSEPMSALGMALQEQSLQAYQNVQRTGSAPSSLQEAALLALTLRERRRLTGTWSGMIQEILPKHGQPETIWGAPLAILMSLVPDPEELLRSLFIKNTPQVVFDWAAHAQLCQPVSAADHVQAFTRLLHGLGVTYQLSLLRSLSLHGRETLAAAIADRLVLGHPAFAALRVLAGQDDIDTLAVSNRALALHEMGTFYQFSGDTAQAMSLFDAAQTALEQWQANLQLQSVSLHATVHPRGTTALDDITPVARLAAASGQIKDELGAVLSSHPKGQSLIDQVPQEAESAFLQIKRAGLMADREPGLARDLARQGAANLTAAIQSQGIPFHGDFVIAWQPQNAVQTLADMDLNGEGLSLVLALLEIRPVDIPLLILASQIYEKTGCTAPAIHYATCAAVLDPQNAAWHRVLGLLWAQAGVWERSVAEWQHVLALTTPALLADRLACANAALQAGSVDDAVTRLAEILSEDANNGGAQALMGQALVAQGKPQQALSYLVRATLLSPENLTAWLALAHLQQVMDEPVRALETLRAAVAALPEAPEAQMELAEACTAAGLLADALPHLKKATQLAPESALAALRYGQALRQLGHLSEARAVLERHRAAWNTHPELALEFARVMVDLGEPERALPVLETALRNGLVDIDGQLLYAKILLGDFRSTLYNGSAETDLSRIQVAEQSLQRIVEADPENLEARLLIADILREKGALDRALVSYQDLADSSIEIPHELFWRIQWGLGRTALGLGETDIALASIKEACQACPNSLPLLRSLAEVSLRAALPQEALEAAANALEFAPSDVENLSWYANFVAAVGEVHKAVEALDCAVQIDPQRADLLVTLAHWQLSDGDLNAARETLQRMIDLPGARREDLRRAAQIYLRLQDPEAAVQCFDRALKVDPEAPADLLFEVAQLYQRLGNAEAALELAQHALEQAPDDLLVSMLQADLLVSLKRPQAALAIMERALRIAQGQEEDPEQIPDERRKLLGEIHERFTRLMIQQGSLPAALDHAEKALALDPQAPGRCYQAADLALAVLQYDRAARILRNFEAGRSELPLSLLEQGKEGLNLFSLRVSIAIDAGEEGVADWVEEGLRRDPAQVRLLAARARILAGQGDITAARKSFGTARDVAGKTQPGSELLWLAEAALAAQEWRVAQEMFEQYALANPNEARAQLGLARVLVMSAEAQRLCAAVACTNNAPGEAALDEHHRQWFEEAIQNTEKLANAGEIGRWQARGQSVFTPSTQNLRALASMPAHPDDTAALIAMLRLLNNRAAAVQVARRHSDAPIVLLQLALCYLGDASPEGPVTARRAIAANPGQPLTYAALAVLSLQSGEQADALEAYENALAIWPNEPAWHDAAGDLCLQAGSLQASIMHRAQALALDPGNPRFAFKLGQAHLADEDIAEAISYLEKSCSLDPHQAEVWLTLASAYHMAGRLPQALEAAKQASTLNPAQAEGLLIAGETALTMGQPDQALEFARGAVRREPENAAAVLFLSNVLVMRDQAEEGLAVLEGASPAVKAAFPIAFERARLIHRLHGPNAAVELLEKLAREYDEEPGLLGFLARTQAECGDAKAAERYAFKALRLDPDQPDLTLMLGRLQRKSGQLDQAVHLLSEVIRMAPNNIEAYMELGSVYQDRREFPLALQVYRQAIHVAPEDYQPYYQSGLILRDSKDYSAAETMLRKAAELAPENLSIRRQLVGVIALNLVHNKQEVTIP